MVLVNVIQVSDAECEDGWGGEVQSIRQVRAGDSGDLFKYKMEKRHFIPFFSCVKFMAGQTCIMESFTRLS